jgi:hypothetical protein
MDVYHLGQDDDGYFAELCDATGFHDLVLARAVVREKFIKTEAGLRRLQDALEKLVEEFGPESNRGSK